MTDDRKRMAADRRRDERGALADFLPFVFCFLIFSGCNPARTDLAVFNARFEAADFNQAAVFAGKKIKVKPNPSGSDLLWTLQLAASERAQLNHTRSIAAFDSAEEMLKYYDEKSNELMDAAGSTIVNDNILPYRGENYVRIMVNTYKALGFIAQNNHELARVELNRALDRQIRAREHFNAEIRKLQDQLAKQKEQNNYDVNAMVDDPNVAAKITEYYPNLSLFQPYPDFVNPFTTYLAGVFFAITGDEKKAEYLLKESYGMVPGNDYIAKDLVLVDELLANKTKLENYVWVIFENGLGPVKEEVRVDLPLVLAAGNIYYTGIALPRLQMRSDAYPYLMVQTGTQEYQTKQVADMERVIMTEFNKDFRGILARAIASAVVKAAAQYAVKDNDKYGVATALLAIYTAATTTADVRIWSALPKDFQVARCAIPADRKLRISPAGGMPFEINIPPCTNAIVYIKIIAAGATPVTEILTF